MRIHLGGHLAYYQPEKQSWVERRLTSPTPLRQVLEELGLPVAEIAITLVNGHLVDLESALVKDEDIVQVYPPSNGG